MRRTASALMMTLCLLLSGCGGGSMDKADQLTLDLRGEYLGLERVTAQMEVEADYGRRVYDYTIALDWRREGETTLSVTEPEELAGITARIAEGKTFLEFDGVSLETGPLDESGLSPLSAAPELLRAAAEGFIAESGFDTLGEQECLRLLCRDPEGEPGVGTEHTLWFDPSTGNLLRGEISVDGQRVITCEVRSFVKEKAGERQPQNEGET